jgi:uncharacterized OsmC-like protein
MVQEVGGQGAEPSPGWFFRAGIASCTETMIALRAAERSVKLSRLEVRVESRSDECGMIGVGDGVPPGPLDATMQVRVEADVPPDILREIVDWGVSHSPMTGALTRAVPLEVRVEMGRKDA